MRGWFVSGDDAESRTSGLRGRYFGAGMRVRNSPGIGVTAGPGNVPCQSAQQASWKVMSCSHCLARWVMSPGFRKRTENRWRPALISG